VKDDLKANSQIITSNSKAANSAEYSIHKKQVEMTDSKFAEDSQYELTMYLAQLSRY